MATRASTLIEAPFAPSPLAQEVVVGTANITMPSSVDVGEEIPIEITFERRDDPSMNALPDQGEYEIRQLVGNDIGDDVYDEGTFDVSDGEPDHDTASVVVESIGDSSFRTFHFMVVVRTPDMDRDVQPVGGHDVVVSASGESGNDNDNDNDDTDDETQDPGVPWYAVAIALVGLGGAGLYYVQ